MLLFVFILRLNKEHSKNKFINMKQHHTATQAKADTHFWINKIINKIKCYNY